MKPSRDCHSPTPEGHSILVFEVLKCDSSILNMHCHAARTYFPLNSSSKSVTALHHCRQPLNHGSSHVDEVQEFVGVEQGTNIDLIFPTCNPIKCLVRNASSGIPNLPPASAPIVTSCNSVCTGGGESSTILTLEPPCASWLRRQSTKALRAALEALYAGIVTAGTTAR
jgi:hypothetical protein